MAEKIVSIKIRLTEDRSTNNRVLADVRAQVEKALRTTVRGASTNSLLGSPAQVAKVTNQIKDQTAAVQKAQAAKLALAQAEARLAATNKDYAGAANILKSALQGVEQQSTAAIRTQTQLAQVQTRAAAAAQRAAQESANAAKISRAEMERAERATLGYAQAMARLQQAQGNFTGAQTTLRNALAQVTQATTAALNTERQLLAVESSLRNASSKADSEILARARSMARLQQISGDTAAAIKTLEDALSKVGNSKSLAALRAQLQLTYLTTNYANSPLIGSLKQIDSRFDTLLDVVRLFAPQFGAFLGTLRTGVNTLGNAFGKTDDSLKNLSQQQTTAAATADANTAALKREAEALREAAAAAQKYADILSRDASASLKTPPTSGGFRVPGAVAVDPANPTATIVATAAATTAAATGVQALTAKADKLLPATKTLEQIAAAEEKISNVIKDVRPTLAIDAEAARATVEQQRIQRKLEESERRRQQTANARAKLAANRAAAAQAAEIGEKEQAARTANEQLSQATAAQALTLAQAKRQEEVARRIAFRDAGRRERAAALERLQATGFPVEGLTPKQALRIDRRLRPNVELPQFNLRDMREFQQLPSLVQDQEGAARRRREEERAKGEAEQQRRLEERYGKLLIPDIAKDKLDKLDKQLNSQEANRLREVEKLRAKAEQEAKKLLERRVGSVKDLEPEAKAKLLAEDPLGSIKKFLKNEEGTFKPQALANAIADTVNDTKALISGLRKDVLNKLRGSRPRDVEEERLRANRETTNFRQNVLLPGETKPEALRQLAQAYKNVSEAAQTATKQQRAVKQVVAEPVAESPFLARLRQLNQNMIEAGKKAEEELQRKRRQGFAPLPADFLTSKPSTAQRIGNFLQDEGGFFKPEALLNALAGTVERIKNFFGITSQQAATASASTTGSLNQIGTAASALAAKLTASASGATLLTAALVGIVTVLGAAYLGFKALSLGADVLQSIAQAGLAANSQLEQTRLGIASVVASVGELRNSGGVKLTGIEALNAALPLAEQQLQKIRLDALQTALTFEQIVPAFLQAVGPGLAGGLGLDQIRKTVIDVSQLIIPLTGNAAQLGEELRAILSGEVRNTSQVAKTLGITKELVEQAKEQGRFADFLNEKLAVAAVTGRLMGKTFEAATSNLQEAGAILAQTVTQGLFEKLRDQLNALLPQVFNTAAGNVQIAPEFNGIANSLSAVFDRLGTVAVGAISLTFGAIKQLSVFLNENRSLVELLVASFTTLATLIGTGLITAFLQKAAFSLAAMAASALSASAGLLTLETALLAVRAAAAFLFTTPAGLITLAATVGVATLAFGLLEDAVAKTVEQADKLKLSDIQAQGNQIGLLRQQVAQADSLTASQSAANQQQERFNALLATLPPRQQAVINALSTQKTKVDELGQSLRENLQDQQALARAQQVLLVTAVAARQREIAVAEQQSQALRRELEARTLLLSQGQRQVFTQVRGDRSTTTVVRDIAQEEAQLAKAYETSQTELNKLRAAQAENVAKLGATLTALNQTEAALLAEQRAGRLTTEQFNDFKQALDNARAASVNTANGVQLVTDKLSEAAKRANEAQAALAELFQGDPTRNRKEIDTRINKIIGQALAEGRGTKGALEDFQRTLKNRNDELGGQIREDRDFKEARSAIEDKIAPPKRGGGRGGRAVTEESVIARTTRELTKLRIEVAALQRGGGDLFRLEFNKAQFEQAKQELNEVLRLRQQLGLNLDAPLPQLISKVDGKPRFDRRAQLALEVELRDLNREKQAQETALKLTERQKDAELALREARDRARAPQVSARTQFETLRATEQADRREGFVRAEAELEQLRTRIAEREGRKRLVFQQEAVNAQRKATLSALDATQQQELVERERTRQLRAAFDGQGPLFKEIQQKTKTDRLKDSNDAKEQILRNEALLREGLIDYELDVTRARSEAAVNRLKEERATAIAIDALEKDLRDRRAGDPQLKRIDVGSFNRAQLEEANRTLATLTALREQDAQGFTQSEEFKTRVLTAAEAQRRQAAHNVAEDIIRLQDEIAYAAEGAADRYQLAYLKAIRNIQTEDEAANVRLIENQIKLARQTELRYQRLNDGVIDLLASQKGLTESLADFRTNQVKTVFEGLDAGVDKLTQRFGKAGEAVRQLLKDLLRLSVTKVFEKLFGLGPAQQAPSGGAPGFNFAGLLRPGASSQGGGFSLFGGGGGGFNPFGSSFGVGPGFGTPGFGGGAPGFFNFANPNGTTGGGPLGLVRNVLRGTGGKGFGGLLNSVLGFNLFKGAAFKGAVSNIGTAAGSNLASLAASVTGPAGTTFANAPTTVLSGTTAAPASFGATSAAASLGALGLVTGGALGGSLLGGRSGPGRLLGGIGGGLLGAFAGASGLFGAGIAGSFGALAPLLTNPFTAVIAGGLLLGGFLFGRRAKRELNAYKKLIQSEYDVVVKDNKILEQIKALGKEKFGKGYKDRQIETIRLDEAKQLIIAYADQTSQPGNKKLRSAELTDPSDPRNIFAQNSVIQRVRGGDVPGPTLGRDYVPALLDGGEFVVNADRTRRIGNENLTALNEGRATVLTNEQVVALRRQIEGMRRFATGKGVFSALLRKAADQLERSLPEADEPNSRYVQNSTTLPVRRQNGGPVPIGAYLRTPEGQASLAPLPKEETPAPKGENNPAEIAKSIDELRAEIRELRRAAADMAGAARHIRTQPKGAFVADGLRENPAAALAAVDTALTRGAPGTDNVRRVLRNQ